MKPRVIAAGVLASLWLLGLPTWAVEYRLQVVNLDALTVLAHIDHSGPAPHGEARQSHLEARLDNGGFSAAAALPGRQVHLLHDPGYGGTPPAWRQVCAQRQGFGLDHAAVGRASRRPRGVRGQQRDASLAGSGGRGREPGRGLEAVGHRPWGMVRTLTAGGPRGRGRVSRPCRGAGHLHAVSAQTVVGFPEDIRYMDGQASHNFA